MPKNSSRPKGEVAYDRVQDIFVSIAVILSPESAKASAYLTRLATILRANYANYEIIVIANDAPKKEVTDIRELLGRLPTVRLIVLSQQHEMGTAIFAGLDAAIGDYVCSLDQVVDPCDVVPDIIEAVQGANIVQGVSTLRMKGGSIGRYMFYWYNRKYMNINIPMNATYLMAFNRRAITAITNSNRDHRFVRHLTRVVGFKLEQFMYTPTVNPEKSHGLRSGTIQALETITSYSTHPLRVIGWIGAIASFLNLTFAMYVVVVNVVQNNVAEGWTTTSLQLSTMFFLLFAAVVIISEYIGRILSEQRNDQKYIIEDEFSSTVSVADFERKNITK